MNKLKLAINPFDPSLKTHRVKTPSLGLTFSSSVTYDLRILWFFIEDNKAIILAVKLQGHDTVYN